MANKIQYGISNVYYAVETAEGQYSTPVHMPGGENLAITNSGGDQNIIYADNQNYWSRSSSSGKQGDLQMAKFPESFLTDVLGQEKDETTGGIIEGPGDTAKNFAFMFQLEGDQGGKRVCWYHCSATVPVYTAATATDTITEASETSTITASPTTISGKLRTQISMETGDTGYNTFFSKVPLSTDPDEESGGGQGAGGSESDVSEQS